MRQAAQEATARAVGLGLARQGHAQHVDQHHLEQPIEHVLSARPIGERLVEEQAEQGLGAFEVGQRALKAGRQRHRDRVEGPVFEAHRRADQVGAGLRIGLEAMRQGA